MYSFAALLVLLVVAAILKVAKRFIGKRFGDDDYRYPFL
jgi:hypothetical protein